MTNDQEPTANPEFWQGIEQFNRQEFYACHDTLESLWLESAEPIKKFYQGILQVAVGCYHLSNHNWQGAVILLGEGINRLSSYGPICEEIDVAQLIEESSQLLEVLQETGPEKVAAIASQLNLSDSSAKQPELSPQALPPCKLPHILRVS